MKNLNQERAIKFKDGPCLVVSGPGSGKTYVITNRICELINRYKTLPQSILVITFTRASANEMKTRFLKLARDNNINTSIIPTFGTFHSVFYEILRKEFGYKTDSLITKDESIRIIDKVLKDFDLYQKISSNTALKCIGEYKLAKERDEEYISDKISLNDFKKLYYTYNKILCSNRKLDFSDMIEKCSELLENNENILSKYQKRFIYVLIDEFQDINKLQYKLVKLICKSKNLFVVGDDDQSIYSFRGSAPSIMKDFLRDYKNASIIYLDINYRSKSNIVEISKKLIEYNKNRLKKNFFSYDNGMGNIEVRKFVDSRDENKYLIYKIKKYLQDGYNMNDIAILYRTNQISHALIQSFSKNGIKYKVRSDDRVDENDAISLMTFHLSKGLEYKIVFIIDANDGLTPHKKSIKEYELETERRLFYVALTRAKINIHIFFTTRRFGKNYMASRFILEALGD